MTAVRIEAHNGTTFSTTHSQVFSTPLKDFILLRNCTFVSQFNEHVPLNVKLIKVENSAILALIFNDVVSYNHIPLCFVE